MFPSKNSSVPKSWLNLVVPASGVLSLLFVSPRGTANLSVIVSVSNFPPVIVELEETVVSPLILISPDNELKLPFEPLSIKILFDKYGHNFNVLIEVINVNNKDELKTNYDLINKNTPLPEFPESIDKNIPETVALYFKEKYPSIWSKTSRARRPHIYFNYFQEALGVLTDLFDL